MRPKPMPDVAAAMSPRLNAVAACSSASKDPPCAGIRQMANPAPPDTTISCPVT